MVKAEIKQNCIVKSLKEKVLESLGYESDEFSLSYRGREICDANDLEFYRIENDDLLILEKDRRDHFHQDLESVENAREWLEENIGMAGSEAELRNYSRTSRGEKEMIFGFEDQMAKLVLSEGKVEDYGLVSSKNM